MMDYSHRIKYILLLVPVIGGMLLSGCYKDKEELLYAGSEFGCDTLNVSYAEDIVPILETHCYACHGTANYLSLGSSIQLEGYDNLKIIVGYNTIIGAVSHDGTAPFMPKNSNKLNDCKVATIRQWVNDGALNN